MVRAFATFEEMIKELERFEKMVQQEQLKDLNNSTRPVNPDAVYKRINTKLCDVWERDKQLGLADISEQIDTILDNCIMPIKKKGKMMSEFEKVIDEARDRIEILKETISKMSNIKCNNTKGYEFLLSQINQIVQGA
ncbi:hypothetical protein CPIN18021_0324 [Campylobacter pinnipediorum subsp. caledonicus]|uniref:Uncharacterized protein n=1 Tax=Campylobacter pinnipediorum subsp. caledonicus TaxID=1874362 RepID=A0A1S6U5Z7_9BACT|nr:hypothetical protein [Campylobacter pinnipediorum]AQW85567.1 hypothetical protein CPIN18020_0326 [Campylobacter pinnipediorum subsp. caledonicus]AQW87171.1 hypothetical protein CPIN18021_0324 [Campylobacter pinnipediorum subsp. caledonicus]OPA71848.1 hypothetical protein BB381_06850 [Campylobacter pinnipediorum subsp. caledonicus]